MNNTKPLFEDILDAVDEATVEKTKSARQFKKGRGRPKSNKTLEAEKQAHQKDFIEKYETLDRNRPEPQRLIVALSLPEDEQKQALEDALQPRQRMFCREYIIDFNRTAAAIRAGYSPKTAGTVSYNLMQYRGVRKLIDIYTASKAQQVTTIDADYIIRQIVDIVESAQKDSDKLRGLELLARHKGMFIERTEISGRDGEAIKIEETRNQANDVARQLREMGKKTALAAVS